MKIVDMDCEFLHRRFSVCVCVCVAVFACVGMGGNGACLLGVELIDLREREIVGGDDHGDGERGWLVGGWVFLDAGGSLLWRGISHTVIRGVRFLERLSVGSVIVVSVGHFLRP